MKSRFFLKLLHATSMKRAGIGSSGLDASMRKLFDDSFQVLFCAFWRSGKRDNHRLVPDARHGPCHHSNWARLAESTEYKSRGRSYKV